MFWKYGTLWYAPSPLPRNPGGDPSYQSTTFLLTITCLRAPQIMRFLFSQNCAGFSNAGHFHYFENSENDKISFWLDKQKCWNPVFSTPGRENLSESWISEGFWRLSAPRLEAIVRNLIGLPSAHLAAGRRSPSGGDCPKSQRFALRPSEPAAPRSQFPKCFLSKELEVFLPDLPVKGSVRWNRGCD